MNRFDGKVALVTGGGGGIGSAIARRLASEGAHVVVTDVNGEAAEAVAQAIRADGYAATAIAADIARAAACHALVTQVLAALGKVDILVNNAGINRRGNIMAISEDDWDATFAVNIDAMFHLCRAVIPQMMAQGGGAIVNTASVAGLGAAPKMSIYAASKHAVIGLTKSAAIEYAKKKIRVNAVCPAVIDTDMYRRAHEADPKKAEFVAVMHPVGRIGTVNEIASAVLYLCSDGASFTTGHSLAVDGGVTAM
jgi:NAD(P)-dependent dehydrogenase (short-subunit alcohol dehydrogenase family)